MFSRDQEIDFEPLFGKALNALKHRGPDDRGTKQIRSSEGALGLGHTRLSIIDLSEGGRQPMHSSDGRFTLVFNGEIYNYKELRAELRDQGHEFRTKSDSEVLLACWSFWGKSCLKRLRGMFAFSIHDKRDETVTCARDAFGIKPFFYTCDANAFSFASEIPALLLLLEKRPALNLQLAHDYLVYGAYDDREATFHEGIRHLAPGHMMTFYLSKPANPEMERWWFPCIKERADLSIEEVAEQLREKFLLNVRLHLRSDVPLGVALSGGLDSSALVCAMRHLEPDLPINTFSFVARDTPGDEESWVDEINEHVGASPHKVKIDPNELAEDLDDMIRAQGEPFGSTSIYAQYRVFRLAKEHGTKVLLEGQGADELLGGYHGYSHARIRSLLDQGKYAKLMSFLKAWGGWPGRSFGNGLLQLGSILLPDALHPLARKLSGRSPRPKWMNDHFLEKEGLSSSRPQADLSDEASARRLSEALRNALTGKGLAALLRHSDRNSMRWSIESRVPFLTTDLAEFLLGLPEDFLVSDKGETKSVFRLAMKGIVPDTVLNRRDKVGFSTPERHWLASLGKKPLSWIEGLKSIPFVNFDASLKTFGESLDENRPLAFEAWRLMNLGRWIQIHGHAA